MKKIIRKNQKILMFIIIALFSIIMSEKFHEFTQNNLKEICKYILPILLSLLLVVGFFERIVYFWQVTLSKKEQKLWDSIKETARCNMNSLVDKKRTISIPIIYRLLVIYHRNTDMCKKLLELLIEVYDSNDNNKSIIAYILLDRSGNSVIADFFNERPDLKQQCEKLSKENAEFILDYNIENDGLSEKFIVGLLNGCLPNNPNKEKMIYQLRCLSSWVLRKQSGMIDDNEKNVIMVVAGLIPLIRCKLYDSGMDDKDLINNLDEIERSKWLKNILCEAYRSIRKELNDEISDLVKINSNMKYLGLICTYYEKLYLYQRESIYNIIKNRKRSAKMCLDSDNKMLALVLFASPMERSASEEDTIYILATIACTCAGEFVK